VKIQNIESRSVIIGLSAALSFFCADIAFSQILEEIVVTAQKREQNLQDVGISVTAFSGDQMAALGYTNTTDISAQTPSLTISQFHPTLTTINIRGVSQNDFADHLEPPVAVYFDEAYVSSMGAAYLQMFDLERVETLRGPQGTLFGRNATGGLVHFISRKPGEDFDASVSLTIAEYEQIKFEGAVGGAINETHSVRLAIAGNAHDGYIENNIGEDLRDAESYAMRAQWLIHVNEDADILLRVNHSTDESTGGGYQHNPSAGGPDGLGREIGRNELGTFFDFDGNPFTTCPGCDAFGYKEASDDPFEGSFDEVGMFERDITGVNGKITWDFENFTLTSITDYLTMDKDYSEDTEGSAIAQVVFTTEQDFDQFSQEIRLDGETENSRWIAGVYYLDIDTDVSSGINLQDIGPFVGAPPGFVLFTSIQTSEITTQSWAVFAHLEYDIHPEWTLTGAVRYTEDEREMDYVLADNFGTFQQFNTDLFSSLARQEFENVSLKAQLDWRPTDDVLVYAGYNRGHKAGNFSAPFIGPIADFSEFPHDEEVLTSFEVGFKATLFEGKARLNADLFHYEYEDYQASFFVGIAQSIRNLDATVDGAEIELVLNPAERWEFLFGASILDTEAEDVGMPDGTLQDRGLPSAPDYSLNGLARYTWPLRDGSITLQADANYVDDFCFTVVCHHTEEEDSYVLANARLSYATDDGRWSVAAFVRNLTDEEYRVFVVDSSFLGWTQQAFGPPRWSGVEVRYSMQ
jgi:iron complex outermembrane receptor protein